MSLLGSNLIICLKECLNCYSDLCFLEGIEFKPSPEELHIFKVNKDFFFFACAAIGELRYVEGEGGSAHITPIKRGGIMCLANTDTSSSPPQQVVPNPPASPSTVSTRRTQNSTVTVSSDTLYSGSLPSCSDGQSQRSSPSGAYCEPLGELLFDPASTPEKVVGEIEIYSDFLVSMNDGYELERTGLDLSCLFDSVNGFCTAFLDVVIKERFHWVLVLLPLTLSASFTTIPFLVKDHAPSSLAYQAQARIGLVCLVWRGTRIC